MDIRERIIQEITETLQAKVPGDVLDLVQDILIMELNQYEIQERCTEVDIPDTSAEGQLKRYIATKRLDRGMNIQDVAAILGHADLKTTQIYCYISQQNVKTAYRKYTA